MAKLKKKNKLNYRPGGSQRSCTGCDAFVPDYRLMGMENTFLRYEARCKIMGVEAGHEYRISPHNVCDRFDQTERMRRAMSTC